MDNGGMTNAGFILKIVCPDQPGIVYAVSQFLFQKGANIIDSAQFSDRFTGRFFMRVHFEAAQAKLDLQNLERDFQSIAQEKAMQAEFFSDAVKPRVLIMVSKLGHCLNDLLFRAQSQQLPIDIAAVVSNHEDFKPLVESYQIPFYCLPLSDQSDPRKSEQEAFLLNLIEEQAIDLVVLARYMQILSNDLCERLSGRVINIHHSFLPSFKGARPYLQAHQRGVKLIGATAHYVTADLDEGPIIEQGVARVDHTMDPEQLAAIGRDVECMALAKAVRWHAEHRILLNGQSTVVFQ
ncbi:MAG: formyltetrahydrofolate deformylase [Pseudomonadota bacterium]|jgi:formyltetrahydrofolate deformylase